MSDLSDKLHSAPFVRLLVPFIAGIVLGDHCPPEWKWIFLALAVGFSLLLPFLINVSFKREALYGVSLLHALFFLGIFIAADLKYRPEQLPKKDYFAIVNEYPEEREKSFRIVIRLIEPRIKVLAYFEKTDSFPIVEPGSIVWFRGKPELLQKTGNPFEFDYQAFAIRNQIGHRIFLKRSDYHFLSRKRVPDLAEESLVIRDRLLKIIEKCGLKGPVFHLVSSVSLGARDELEPEITQSFSKTGVTHVLAVSGMNVAIIYVVLEFFLRFLNRKRWGILIQTIIILAGVWGYAFITGLSASVLRAAAMFSFIMIGKSLNRNSNIYNTLAASAFVLLCYNPSLVYDVGFQLSYAAVFSIVYFHPFIYGLYYSKFWIADQIWLMLSVSMAAQIGTIPFLLHYFHQFPTWFLLANLMVIPLVTVILYLSFIVFAIAPVVPFLGILMTRVLDWAGQGMLFSVHFVEHLPYSVLQGLYPSDLTLFLVVLFAILFSVFIVYKIREALFYALILMIVLLIINTTNVIQKQIQQEVVLFNLPGKTLVALTTGKETIWLTTDKSGTKEKFKSYIKPYEGFRGIRKSSILCYSDSSVLNTSQFEQRQNFLNFKGLTICLLNDRGIIQTDWNHFPPAELIILSGKKQLDRGPIPEYLNNAIWVEDRPTARDTYVESSTFVPVKDSRHFDTNLGGAVQIRFKPASPEIIKIISCGYFSAH